VVVSQLSLTELQMISEIFLHITDTKSQWRSWNFKCNTDCFLDPLSWLNNLRHAEHRNYFFKFKIFILLPLGLCRLGAAALLPNPPHLQPPAMPQQSDGFMPMSYEETDDFLNCCCQVGTTPAVYRDAPI
jgi:hypothetical protein